VVELAGTSADPRELVLASGKRSAIVGDPEQWQSRWGAITALRSTADVVFHGCSITEFRALSRSRELPPPTAQGLEACWLLSDDGTVRRVRLPGAGQLSN